MSNLRLVDEEFQRVVEEREREASLKSAGGDGTSGGMEARIAKLEAHVEHIRDDLAKLADVPADLATLKSRVDALPDKDWVGLHFRNWIGGSLALLTLLTLFGDKLRHLLGV